MPGVSLGQSVALQMVQKHTPGAGWMLARWSWTVHSTWASACPSPSPSSAGSKPSLLVVLRSTAMASSIQRRESTLVSLHCTQTIHPPALAKSHGAQALPCYCDVLAQQLCIWPAHQARSQIDMEPVVAGGYFDPLSLVDGQDEARTFRLKEAEIKHGRLAMVAFLGMCSQSSCCQHLSGH